jgi:hypothetical protein
VTISTDRPSVANSSVVVPRGQCVILEEHSFQIA